MFLKKKYVSILCAGIFAAVFVSCKEDVGLVGLNLQPDEELLNTDFFDTATIVAYSVLNDSITTSNTALNLLGDITDPVFGRAQAAIYTQFRLSSMKVDFGENAQADSLMLYLAYGGYYGDTLKSLRIRVYEVSEEIKSTAYYGNSSLTHNSEVLADVQIQPTPNTKDTSSAVAYMSIPLSVSFATTKFLSKSGKNELSDDANFADYFKGLYIEAEAVSSNGCMLSIDLLHPNTFMTLYYGNSEKQNQSFPFKIIKDSCNRFSSINHFDYAGATPNLSAQLNGDYSSAEEELYGQAAGGIKTVMQFPHLKEMFADKQVIIHKAELIISRKDDNLPNYDAPAALSLSYDSKTDKNQLLFDYALAVAYNASYFGGTYDETTKQYAFRITKYVQMLIDSGTDDYKLNLMVTAASVRMSRSIYYGTNPAADNDKRIKLKIHYTLINK
ncbi:MAG: DUF4270 domain-containing protein [Lentimicrobiaceae bacterium]|nr:DUF4270 domain-containing protein [Lentimicrobiaceae bacterium]